MPMSVLRVELPAGSHVALWRAAEEPNSELAIVPVGQHCAQIRWTTGDEFGGLVCTVPRKDAGAVLLECSCELESLRPQRVRN